MPQQCCPLPRTPLCGVCVCGARALCIRKLWHFAHFLSTVKTCQDMSSFLTHTSFPSSSPVTAFCVISCRRRRHKVLPAHTHIALQLFCILACGNLRQKWLHFTFFLSFLTCHIQHPQRQQQLRQQHTQPTWPGNPHQET